MSAANGKHCVETEPAAKTKAAGFSLYSFELPDGRRDETSTGHNTGAQRHFGETTMLRKLTLGLTAAIALTAAALAPTSASAFTVKFGGGGGGWHPHHHHHHHHSAFWGPSYGPGYSFSGPVYSDCLQKRVVQTNKGPRLRTVNVCY